MSKTHRETDRKSARTRMFAVKFGVFESHLLTCFGTVHLNLSVGPHPLAEDIMPWRAS
jgi:hypothetical protein